MNDFFDSLIAPLSNTLGPFIPKLGGALLVLIIGWIIAKLVQFALRSALGKTSIGRSLASKMGRADAAQQTAASIGKGGFWIVMLFAFIAAFEALGLTAVTEPLRGLLDTVMQFLPRIISAGILLLVAWGIATILRMIIGEGLGALGIDRRFSSAAADGNEASTFSLSKTIADVVYYFVFLLFLPGVLDALALDGMLAPVQDMLAMIMNSIPKIIAAGVILAVAYFVGRLVSKLISNLLASMGFNSVPQKLGFNMSFDARRLPSDMIGVLVLGFIMLFAAVEAAGMLGFGQLSEIMTGLVGFAGNVLIAVVIMALGLWLANMAGAAIKASGGGNAGTMAMVARVAILVLVGAMALTRLGVGDNIIQLAFGLLLGAIAVAAAIAFGWGGRDAAARYLDRWKNQA